MFGDGNLGSLNYKYLLLSNPWHIEGQIRWTLRTLILLGKSDELFQKLFKFR